MNEDITQAIYYCMIKAGYDEKIAQILCGNEFLKEQFRTNREDALRKANQEMIENYKMMKDEITKLFTPK